MLAAARQIYPDRKLGTIKNRFNLISAILKIRPQLRGILARPEHQGLRAELQQHPETLGFAEWPYIHAGWSAMQRFEALSQHKQALQSDMRLLDIGRSDSIVVADLSALSPGLKLVVDRAVWCVREGSLVFNLFVGDDRLMMMGFSFGMKDGERIAYVGSLQGSNLESALEIYRDLTKSLERLRPRDFLIKALQYLMFHLGVKKLLCVADEQRHHRHPYFTKHKNEKFHLNYDEVWSEHAGELEEGGFFRLGVVPVTRPLEEVAAKNRSQYRRRYAMLDQVSADLARFAKGEAPSIAPQEP
ncbi:DUF535 family protein [Sphaerotilaceae bacterium SBD11-9]